MKNYRTLILDKKNIMGIVTIKESIKTIEYAFKQLGEGKVQMPAKLYIHLDKYNGDFRAMPAFIEGINCCGLKWVNVHPNNKIFGLPTVMAVIILSDPRTGFPLCIMDATYATQLRTGSAGAVASKYLARTDSSRIALIGCGTQARSQLLCLVEIFRIKKVKVWGPIEPLARKFAKEMKNLNLEIKVVKDISSCVKNTDIIVTTTPSRKPLLKLDCTAKGTHINAIGADAKGKQELDPAILKNAKIVVDNWEQASHSGEINVPVSKGIITKNDIYADIGQIVSGKKKGRTNNNEITIFDSTGLAVQDIALANLIYNKAIKLNKGKWINLF